jgi:cytochrome P450 family 4 subfamily V
MAYTREFAQESGVLRLWIGPHALIGLSRAETAEVVFNSSKHMTKSSMYYFLHPWLGTGLLTRLLKISIIMIDACSIFKLIYFSNLQ